MKKCNWIIGGLLLVSTILKGAGLAREAAATSDSLSSINLTAATIPVAATDLSTLQALPDEQLTAVVSALDATPTIPMAALPGGGMNGTFWSLQNPTMAPMPYDSSGSDVWRMSDGSFLVNDVNFDYSASSAISLAAGPQMRTMAMDVPGLPAFGDGGTNIYTPDGGSFTIPDYGTNLWIAQVNITNGYLAGIGTNTLADVQYEIQSRTNLAQTDWQSEGVIYGSVLTNWTPISVARGTRTNLFIRLQSWANSDGSGLPDWWEMLYFGHTGVDPYGNPAGDGWSNLQKFQNGMNPSVFYTPPVPQGVTASYDAANGMATISWLPSPGAVTGYKITIRDSYASAVYTVSSNAITVTEPAYNDPWSYFWDGPNAFLWYQVEADYIGSHSVQSASLLLEADYPNNVNVIPGPVGLAYLAANVSGLPPGTTAVRLTRFDWRDTASITNFDVPLTAFTNGLAMLPAAWTAAPLNSYGYPENDQWWVETVANGSANSAANLVGYSSFADGSLLPFYFDGRVQLKQNLIFQLRAAPETSPFEFIEANSVASPSYADSILYPNNYAYSGFYQLDDAFGSSYEPDYVVAGAIDPYWPFHNNVRYQNFVFNQTNLNAGGRLNTGVNYNNQYTNVDGGMILVHPLAFEFQIQTSYASALAMDQTRWLFSYPISLQAGWDSTPIGFTTNSSGGWTFASNARNYWGLPYVSAKLAYNDSTATTLNPGDTYSPPSGVNNTYAYPQTAQPVFQTTEYDFWSYSPVPGSTGFAPTNQSDLLIAPVGSSIGVNGYAKLALQNGYSGVYGYLGQYFDTAYAMTNGAVTTNPTGVLSPYGNFFATAPGPVALVTMPDPDTGARGTGTVYAVSLNVDANHDGTMDLTFNGPDATSQASSMEFWVNGGHDEPGTSGSLDSDLEVPPASTNYAPQLFYPMGHITCQRDLENFARLWLCGMPALTNNYHVTLSWNVSSGSPAINLYNSVETNGGIGYLTDTNIAFQQCRAYAHGSSPYSFYFTGPSVAIANITPASSFTFPANYFTNIGNQYFLFEGAGIGSGQLVLTVADSNSNKIAQTGVWLDLHDVKNFYERAVITDNTSGAISNWNSTVEPVQNQTASISEEDSNIIVLVHGINVDNPAWLLQSDTVFKRLYWAGYQGKFTTVDWPCEFFNFWTALSTDTSVFNRSEIKAYKAGASLKNYLSGLRARFPSNRLNLFVHSQGNAVAGEAIRQGAPFDTYILTQGAMPDSAYDVNAPTDSSLLTAESIYGTPELQPMGYRGIYTNFTGRIVNFYNPNDPVLAYWLTDQEAGKPDGYAKNIIFPTPFYTYDGTDGWHFSLTLSSYLVTDPQESRAYISRSLTLPIGRSGPASAHGVIQSAVDLNAQYGFYNAFPADHSAQWTWPIQKCWGYYDNILESCLIPTIQR